MFGQLDDLQGSWLHNFLFLLLKWTREERKEGGDDDEENNFFSGIRSADVSDSITEEELGEKRKTSRTQEVKWNLLPFD